MGKDSSIAQLKETIALLEAENRDLRVFNETFSSLYDNMAEGVSLHELVRDADGTPVDYRIIDVNPAYERITGIGRDTAVGKLASELYGTGDPPYLDVFAPVAVTGRPSSLETYFPPMDKHFFISIVSPGPNRFAAIFFDITSRKKAEEELSQIFSMSLSLICVADINNATFIKVNPAFSTVLGYSEEEILGSPFLTFVHPEDVEKTVRVIEGSLKKGIKVVSFQNRYRCKDGSYRWLDWVSHPDPSRGITYAAAHDVTELRDATQQLAESENRLRSLLEHAPDAFFAHRPDGRFVMVNEQACRVLGYTQEELLGMSVSDVETGVVDDQVAGIWERVMSGRSVTFEGRHRRKDGSSYPTEIKISSFTHGDAPLIFGFARDISDRKRYAEEKEKFQAQLAQAQKMEAMGTLAGGIAHDFNNLLMGIMGRASLLSHDLTDTSPHLEHIQGIDACVKSAMHLTKQLLGLARGGKYEVKVTDANRLIGDTLEIFARTRKEISVHTDFHPALSAIAVDRAQIGQVLLNIFVNAWQAMPGGGTLSVHTEDTLIDTDQAVGMQTEAGRYVKIAIVDNGIGIPKEIQHRIFDPFFTTKDKGRGTGLGLASAYGIIKNHGGHLSVYSEPGQGSTFNVYLPASAATPSRETTDRDAPITGTGTILLVDDEPNILDIGRLMLERLGYTVYTAGGGPEALTLFQEHRNTIDLIILDMIMPGQGGGKTFDALREIAPECRVILSSGYSINGQATDILNRGCNGFIQKPFNLAQLSRKVHEVITGT